MSNPITLAILGIVQSIKQSMAEGGGGVSVGAQMALNVANKTVFTDKSGGVWLRTGSMESDIVKYGDAFPTSYRASTPNDIKQYSTASINGTYYSAHAVFTSATTHWTAQGANAIEYTGMNVATGRSVNFSGKNLKFIGYNTKKDLLVLVTDSGEVFTVKPDGTEKTEHKVRWIDIWPYGFSRNYCKGFAYDGDHYQFAFTTRANVEVCTQIALDDSFNEVERKTINFNENSSSKNYISCVGSDPSTGVTHYGITYSHGSSNYWRVKTVSNDGRILNTHQGTPNDTIIGTSPLWVAFNPYTNHLHLRGNVAHSSSDYFPFKKAFTNGRSSSVPNMFPTSACSMIDEAGGFGWTIDYNTHTLYQYSINAANGGPELTGVSHELTGFTGPTYGLCGVGDKIWVPEYTAPYKAHEFTLDGVRTGRTLDIPYACRHINSDGEFIYAISYGISQTRIRKYDATGTFVEEITDHDLPTSYNGTYLAFFDGVWVDRAGAYVTCYRTKDFKYIGVEQYEGDINARPSQPYAFNALGLLMFGSGTTGYCYSRDEKSIQLGVGDPVEKSQPYMYGPVGKSNGPLAGLPIYEKIGG